MRINEVTNLKDAISSPIGRDEYIDNKLEYFKDAITVYKINDLKLKKYISSDQTEIYYGLIDDSKSEPILAGILQLEKRSPGWQVRLSQIQQPYKSQGYGSFMYDYTIMNDGLTLHQTEGNLGGSKGLWEKLYRQGRFTVGGYNLDTGEFIPLNDATEISNKIYNQKEDVVWIARPKQLKETIDQMIIRVNSKNRYRTIEWYGQGIQDS